MAFAWMTGDSPGHDDSKGAAGEAVLRRTVGANGGIRFAIPHNCRFGETDRLLSCRNPSTAIQGTKSDAHVAVSSTNFFGAGIDRLVAAVSAPGLRLRRDPGLPYPFGGVGCAAAPTGGVSLSSSTLCRIRRS